MFLETALTFKVQYSLFCSKNVLLKSFYLSVCLAENSVPDWAVNNKNKIFLNTWKIFLKDVKKKLGTFSSKYQVK